MLIAATLAATIHRRKMKIFKAATTVSQTTIAKFLDRKFDNHRSGKYAPRDFIFADAKNPDMALTIQDMGPTADHSLKPGKELLQSIKGVCTSGIIDVMLSSASNREAKAADG